MMSMYDDQCCQYVYERQTILHHRITQLYAALPQKLVVCFFFLLFASKYSTTSNILKFFEGIYRKSQIKPW